MDATNPIPTSSGSVNIQPTQDPPIKGVGVNKLSFGSVGQTYDYSMNISGAGNYIIQARLGTDAGVTAGSLNVHFECPIGTTVAALTLSGANQWQTVVGTKVSALASGGTTMRLVVDALPTPGNPSAFIHWFQVVPSAAVANHSIQLNWTAGVATPPTNPECQAPQQCPLPAGTTPCFNSALSYNLYKSQISGTYGPPLASVSAPVTTYTDNAVAAGQTYFYRVSGVNSNDCIKESLASNEIKVIVPTP
jgi:hypothetical protein